jgi:hypothetical protein
MWGQGYIFLDLVVRGPGDFVGTEASSRVGMIQTKWLSRCFVSANVLAQSTGRICDYRRLAKVGTVDLTHLPLSRESLASECG